MRAPLLALLVTMLAPSAWACASQSQAKRTTAAEGKLACSPAAARACARIQPDRGPPYYVTWTEYYNAVMDDAYRRNSSVIWINPPPRLRTEDQARAPSPPAPGAPR